MNRIESYKRKNHAYEFLKSACKKVQWERVIVSEAKRLRKQKMNVLLITMLGGEKGG